MQCTMGAFQVEREEININLAVSAKQYPSWQINLHLSVFPKSFKQLLKLFEFYLKIDLHAKTFQIQTADFKQFRRHVQILRNL